MIWHNGNWPWFAVQVRTCSEKTSTLLLENIGYQCFLPIAKCVHRWSDRMKEVEIPLFPGYLFCRMNPNQRLPVLKVPGVIQIVGVGKTPLPVEEEEIAALQLAEKSGLPTMPWPFLGVGQTARISRGPLAGLSGIVIKIKSGMKLVLSVSLLQRSMAVEIDRSWIDQPLAEKSGSNGQPHGRMVKTDPAGLKPAESFLGHMAKAD
jgi:transcription antitermination factor NusG